MRTRKQAAIVAAAATTLGMLTAGAAEAAPARPDLVVTNITWAPAAVATGQQVQFTATIKNQGKAATPADVIHGVGFQVDGKLVTWADLHTDTLRPGQAATVIANSGPTNSATWKATTGTHEILAFVDDAKRIAESNEGNNRTKKTFTVTSTPSMTTSLSGQSARTTFPAMKQATGIASSVTGSGYGACFDEATWTPVLGTDTYLGEYSAGPGNYYTNGPFGSSGLAQAPAGSTSAVSSPISLIDIAKWNHGDPGEKITCAAGQWPGFSRFEAKQLTSTRWTLHEGGWEGVTMLATTTAKVSGQLHF
ncbi:CARDB domain-containing protein [Kineococcus sp. SYSU DK003]|uniref:CARDB domain-containing protein n=1 Tax=Kineococcus sp. SYSU DK003 TaxID=3383124 RepID=UPI003D7C4875